MCIWYIVEKPLTPQKFVFGDSSKPAANEISSPARLGRCERWVLGSGFYALWSTSHLESGCQSQKMKVYFGILGCPIHITVSSWWWPGLHWGFSSEPHTISLRSTFGQNLHHSSNGHCNGGLPKNLRKKRWSFSLKNSQVFLHQFWCI